MRLFPRKIRCDSITRVQLLMFQYSRGGGFCEEKILNSRAGWSIALSGIIIPPFSSNSKFSGPKFIE